MIQRIDQKYYNYDIIGDYRIKKCRENAEKMQRKCRENAEKMPSGFCQLWQRCRESAGASAAEMR